MRKMRPQIHVSPAEGGTATEVTVHSFVGESTKTFVLAMRPGDFLRHYHAWQSGDVKDALDFLPMEQRKLVKEGFVPAIAGSAVRIDEREVAARRCATDQRRKIRFGIITKALGAFLLAGAIASSASALSQREAQTDAAASGALLEAIQAVETGGERDPARAVGDHGLAKGWYQMHPDYYADAKAESPWLPAYEVCCADKHLSQMCVVSVWAKYKVRDDKHKTLVHHYGPAGRPGKQKSSDPDLYWPKCRKAITNVRRP